MRKALRIVGIMPVVGNVPRFDNSKIQRELGLTFRQPEETIPETVEDLVRWRYLRV